MGIIAVTAVLAILILLARNAMLEADKYALKKEIDIQAIILETQKAGIHNLQLGMKNYQKINKVLIRMIKDQDELDREIGKLIQEVDGKHGNA